MSLKEQFGETLINSTLTEVSTDTLEGKKVGVYFSAHWCPPCRGFTPTLVEFYNELKEQGKAFEIVFVSSDRDPDSMMNYMEEMKMPWLAIPHGDARAAELKKKYNVTGIPTLVILNPDGSLVTKDGRAAVMQKGPRAFDSW